MTGNYPNLFVLGAPKAGTTSLYEYLSMHPRIYVPPKKEFHFFSSAALHRNCRGPGDEYALRATVSSEADYLDFYDGRSPRHRYAAEVSPSYLFHDEVAGAIHAASPEARLIAVVRDPVERAYSQYLHLRRSQREQLDFKDALDAEPHRVESGWAAMWRYVSSSMYSRNLQSYADEFGRDRLFVLHSEDLRTRHQETLDALFSFLDLPTIPALTLVQRNAGGDPRSNLVAGMLNNPSGLKTVARRAMPQGVRRRVALKAVELNTKEQRAVMRPGERQRLQGEFRAEGTRLAAFTGAPLPWPWLSETP